MLFNRFRFNLNSIQKCTNFNQIRYYRFRSTLTEDDGEDDESDKGDIVSGRGRKKDHEQNFSEYYDENYEEDSSSINGLMNKSSPQPMSKEKVHLFYELKYLNLEDPVVKEKYKKDMKYIENISKDHYKLLQNNELNLTKYYEFLSQYSDKVNLGTVLLLGLEGSGANKVLESLAGMNVFGSYTDSHYCKAIDFKLKRSNNGERFAEFLDNGHRTGAKLYDDKQVAELIYKKCQLRTEYTDSVLYPIEILIVSPEIKADINIRYFPSFRLLTKSSADWNGLIFKMAANTSLETPFNERQIVFSFNPDDLKYGVSPTMAGKLDSFHTSSFGIYSEFDSLPENIKDGLIKRPPLHYTMGYVQGIKKELIWNKLFRNYFAKNQDVFDNLISKAKLTIENNLKKTEGVTEEIAYFSKSWSESKMYEIFVDTLNIDQIMMNIYIKKSIEYPLQCQLNDIFRDKFSDILMPDQNFPDKPQSPVKNIEDYKTQLKRFLGIFNEFYREKEIGEKLTKDDIFKDSLLAYSDIRNDWVTLSKKAPVQEIMNFYRNRESELSTREHFEFHDKYELHRIWLSNHRKIVTDIAESSTICNDIPNIVIESMIQYIESLDSINYPNTYKNIIALQIYNVFRELKNHINPDIFTSIVRKEFIPSLNYYELNLAIYEEIRSQLTNLQPYSFEWNYIYYQTLIKKISEELLRTSIVHIIQPIFFQIFEKKDSDPILRSEIKTIEQHSQTLDEILLNFKK